MLPLGWWPSPPLASSLWGTRRVKTPGVGIWALHQLPALPCALLQDAGVDLLWQDPALLLLLPSWDTPAQWGATSRCSPGISRALQLRGEQPSLQGQEEMPE